MIDYYKKAVFDNYANFSGRARRSEYWYYILANVVIFGVLITSALMIESIWEPASRGFFIAMGIYFLLIILPSLAVIVRRLHDIGKSGWFYFIRLIPIVGPIWLLILLCTEGDKGSNRYGKDPKRNPDEIDEIGTIVY